VSSSQPHSLALGVLGCGTIARLVHLPALASLPCVQVTAIAEPDAVNRAEARKLVPAAREFEDYSELLEHAQIDAAVVCLPSALHAEAATAVLERRRHLYLEKPIATDLDGARGVLEAWRRSGVLAMIGFNYRSHPRYERARASLRRGQLGEIVAARTVFTGGDRAMPDWKRSRASGGGVLLEKGSHHVDLVRFLLGEVRDVSCDLSDNSATLQLRLSSGAAVECRFAEGVADVDRFEIEGRNGKLAIDRHGRWLSLSPDALRKLVRRDYEPSYRRSLARFVEAVRTGVPGSPDLEDGYRSLAVIVAAEESARTGRPVAPEYAA
jgi:predicted dehydrogenase